MVPKKRFGVKYIRQSAPEHSSSNGAKQNISAAPSLEKKTRKSIEGMPLARDKLRPILLRLFKAAMTKASMISISVWI